MVKVVKAAGLGLLAAAAVVGALAFGLVSASADDQLDSLQVLAATQENNAAGAIAGHSGDANSGDASSAVVQMVDADQDAEVKLAWGEADNDIDQEAYAEAESGDAKSTGIYNGNISIGQDNDQDVEQVAVNAVDGDAEIED